MYIVKSLNLIDIQSGNATYGPDLPMILQGHCLIEIDSETILLIGGSSYDGRPLKSTWSYNFIKGAWGQASFLRQSRYGHFCGKFKAAYNKTFAVVVGGQSVAFNGLGLPLSTVEILDISTNATSESWITGPPFSHIFLKST